MNAFCAVFTKAIHLRCFLHFKGNIEHKLRELNIPPTTIKEFIRDIFGYPTLLQRGLVDAQSELELVNMMEKLKDRWNDFEKPFNSPPLFYKWFTDHGVKVIAASMLCSLREKAGLGSPPEPYYTNEIESKNNILKQHLNRKASQLPQFIESMKLLLQGQYEEIKNAVASCGEYRVVPQYSILSFEKQKWFKMSEKQRLNKIAQFMKATVLCISIESADKDADNPLLTLSLPAYMAQTIWCRSQTFSKSDSAIVVAPGDEGAYIVQSNSGNCQTGGYVCDDQCIGYKSSKICAHTVAAVLKSGTITSFLRWYKSLKLKPNFSALANHGKPPSVGKKPRKGMSKRGSNNVQDVILNSNEQDFSSRVPSCQPVNASFTSMQSTDMHQFSSPFSSVDQDLPSVTAPLVTLSNSPVSVHYFGCSTMGQYVHNFTGPPPLVHVPSVSTPAKLPLLTTSSIQQEPRPLVQTQFWLCFVYGNISRCNGCKGKIGRSAGNMPLPPPGDIVFRHRETVIFQNPRSGIFQQSRDPRNVYYHAWKTCIASCFMDFYSSHISIDECSYTAQCHSYPTFVC